MITINAHIDGIPVSEMEMLVAEFIAVVERHGGQMLSAWKWADEDDKTEEEQCRIPTDPRPRWAFNGYCLGLGDLRCVDDETLAASRLRRLFWRIRGALLVALLEHAWRWTW